MDVRYFVGFVGRWRKSYRLEKRGKKFVCDGYAGQTKKAMCEHLHSV